MKKKSWYAVRKGRREGLYKTWDECRKQVIGILEPPTKDFTPRRKQKLFSEAMPENLRQLSMLEEKIRIAL